MRRSLRNRLLLAAAAPVVLLGLLELGAALWEFLPYGARSTGMGPVGLYVEQPKGATERPQLAPGASLSGTHYAIDINRMGFRSPELVEPRPANALRLWCTGGSTTFDIYAPSNASTWPARLQAELQQALPERRVEVINGGIPGEILSGSHTDFTRHHEAVRSDILVVYNGPNDLRWARDVRDHPPMRQGGPLLSFALGRALLRLQASLTDPWTQPEMEIDQEHLHDIQGELERLLDAADLRGVDVVMATHALRLGLQPDDDECTRELRHTSQLLRQRPDAAARAFASYNTMVHRIARERGYAFADVRGAVPADHSYWGDDTHFAAPGSALAGETVARAVLDQILAKTQ